VRYAAAPHAPDGIDGDVRPALSPVDCFVTVLQLAQVLMYELDSIERGRSNTLWMLQTVLDAGEPGPLDGPLPRSPAVTGKHLLPLRGSRWRNVDLTGGCGGVRLRPPSPTNCPPRPASPRADPSSPPRSQR